MYPLCGIRPNGLPRVIRSVLLGRPGTGVLIQVAETLGFCGDSPSVRIRLGCCFGLEGGTAHKRTGGCWSDRTKADAPEPDLREVLKAPAEAVTTRPDVTVEQTTRRNASGKVKQSKGPLDWG